MELGRKIWNLDNAIWTLQGRHRDHVHFADYVYTRKMTDGDSNASHWVPGKINGQWKYFNAVNRSVDRDKFEEFKTRFYTLEGWDTETGHPTRSTLEGLGLKAVADELEGLDTSVLSDAISTLQNLTGVQPPPDIHGVMDISGDSKIGIEEVIHMLQKISGIRE
jgi:hypothetical protein